MSGWTRLYAQVAESKHVADVIMRDEGAFALFALMMATAGVWGRFPADPDLLKAQVAPRVRTLTPERIADLLPILEEPPAGEDAGLVQRYAVDDRGNECLAITKHLLYNAQQQWHKVGAPRFPPPPGWQPPDSLRVYLEKVRQGRFRDKTFAKECARFGIRPDEITNGRTAAPPADETSARPAEPCEVPCHDRTCCYLGDGVCERETPCEHRDRPEPRAAPMPEPKPPPDPPKRPQRRSAADEQAADHSDLYDALEAAYPNYRDVRLRGLLAVYLGLLSQPGCTVSETQLVAALKRDPPLAGGTPDKYMMHVQGMFRQTAGEEEAPARPELSPEQVAEMEERRAAKVQAEMQKMRLQRLSELGIPAEVDEWWLKAQRLLRERESWSVGLSMCWLQSVAGGVATLLVPASSRQRLAPLEAEVVAALEAVIGGPVTLDVRELTGSSGHGGREDKRQAEAIEQARAYVDDCEAYADDPEALSEALKDMFGPDLARIAAQAVTGAAESSEDQGRW